MAGKKGKSKRSKSGKRSKRSKRSKKSAGGFYRVDADGNRCAGFAGSVSPLGNECFWAMRTPGIPREYRRLIPPMAAPTQFASALDVANPLSSYTLRNMGLSSKDARRIAEIRALQGGQYPQYQFGRSLQKGRLGGALPLLAAGGGAIDPMMAMAMGGRGFDPVLFSMAQGGKIDPLMFAMMRGRK